MMNSNQQEVINGFPNRGGAAAKLLVSFADAEASKHYFCTSSLGGGELSHLCTLPGCDNGNHPCTCYVSDVINGVLCFSNGKDVYVLNPSTGDILTLPRSEEYDKLNHANLKNVLYSAYAFGFDPSKKEYKVLHLFGLPQLLGSDLLDDQKFEVFKVRTRRPETTRKGEEEEEEDNQVDAWRKATSLPPCPSYIIRGQGVYVNGSIYWLRVSSPGKDAIVCFDVASEMFRSIPIPFLIPFQRSLSSVRGRLAIQGIEKTAGSTPTLGVWILEDIEESKWNKKTVEIVDPKEQKGVKFHVLVGDDSTGDMVVMRSVMPERFQVVCLSGNKNTAAERTITLQGLPSWVDLQSGNNNKINFKIDNYVESKVPLDPIVIKEVKNPEEVKKVGKYRPPKTQQAFPPPPVVSQRAKKTYYGSYGQARTVQSQQFSRATPSSGQGTHDGYCLSRGVQSQQFSRATQSSGQRTHDSHGQARGLQSQQFSRATQSSGQRTHSSHGLARGGQSQQFSRAAQSSGQRTHDGHGLGRGVDQSQQFSRATQSSGHGQPQPCPKNHNGQTLIRFGEFDAQVLSNSAPRQTLIRIGEIDIQVTI